MGMNCAQCVWSQEYTFTLTQGDGTRVMGFCRRFLPPAARVGTKLRYPHVLCIVCEAPWSTVFYKVCMPGSRVVMGRLWHSWNLAIHWLPKCLQSVAIVSAVRE